MDGSLLLKNKNRVVEFFEILERWEKEEYWRGFSVHRHIGSGRGRAFRGLGAVGGREMERREGMALFAWGRSVGLTRCHRWGAR